MLECYDISTEKVRYSGVRLHFNEEETADEVLTINMTVSAAVDMARWIMQNFGKKRYMTLDEARKIIMEEGANAL